jgi:hypothetical protein
MYSTDGYSKFWKRPLRTCDRGHVCHLKRFMYGTSPVPALSSTFLVQVLRTFCSMRRLNCTDHRLKIGYQTPCGQTGPMHLQQIPSLVHSETSQTYCRIQCNLGHIIQGQPRPWVTGILGSVFAEKHRQAVHERKCTSPNKTTSSITCSLRLIRKADSVAPQHCSQISTGRKISYWSSSLKF